MNSKNNSAVVSTLTEKPEQASSNVQGYRGNALNMRSRQRRNGTHLLIDLPIGARLTLGFFVAALIAALITGTIGFQRSQSLGQQSNFYSSLLKTNTNLTTGSQYLQLINSETQSIVALLASPQPSKETLATEIQAVKQLEIRYNTLLTNYLKNDVLAKQAEQQAVLAIANHSDQIMQQEALTASASRTWITHEKSLNQILPYLTIPTVTKAQYLDQVQVELTNADAQSALRALVQFNGRLANSIKDAETVELQNQIVTTTIGSIIAFLLILLIGWFISGTIVRRLRQLREVTLAVEQGQLDRRVDVIGRDEIADVSGSVNAMLEAIVGLLGETRNQRDALTNAAEHLFTDMRVVSAGDLRINAPVSNDPIGMLANAFNFTVGRFRRFIQRTKATAEQLDVMAHQQIERSEAFAQTIQQLKGDSKISDIKQPEKNVHSRTLEKFDTQPSTLLAQLRQLRELFQQVTNEGMVQHTRIILTLAEQTANTLDRLYNMPTTVTTLKLNPNEIQSHFREELQTLAVLNRRVVQEAQNIQKSMSRDFQGIEKELAQITLTARTFKTSPLEGSAVQESSSTVQEVLRQSTQFMNDVYTMSRQLIQIAQEIRTGIVAFQLDATDNVLKPPAQSGLLNPSNPSHPSNPSNPSNPSHPSHPSNPLYPPISNQL